MHDNVEKGFTQTKVLANPGNLHSKEHSNKVSSHWTLYFFSTVCLTIILCGMITTLGALRTNCNQKPSVYLEAVCPESWIGFQRKCFYFSDDIKNWTSSQIYCDSQGADLVQVETLQELVSHQRRRRVCLFE
ncbi:C-type lectin domain family 2 member D isoform X2 [Eulemur rufifrons]|uniref:C-type lectin domain family 2 member D isoform X2 n=1 Tax=Eulemur rufifrons TaxID=859984 RepID=UPI0037446968